ncbi:hypothetical protein CHU98_g12148 [Xylaria longipes]|nr:hypothetical protein CHU98_g12148 [Xylaria longipes]
MPHNVDNRIQMIATPQDNRRISMVRGFTQDDVLWVKLHFIVAVSLKWMIFQWNPQNGSQPLSIIKRDGAEAGLSMGFLSTQRARTGWTFGQWKLPVSNRCI